MVRPSAPLTDAAARLDVAFDSGTGWADLDSLLAYVARVAASHPYALLLLRRGGWAVARCEGERVVASKVGTRYVQGRTKKGGSSQQRYARRRGNQADSVVSAAVDAAPGVWGSGRPGYPLTLGHRGRPAAARRRGGAAGHTGTARGGDTTARRAGSAQAVLDKAAEAACAVRVHVADARRGADSVVARVLSEHGCGDCTAEDTRGAGSRRRLSVGLVLAAAAAAPDASRHNRLGTIGRKYGRHASRVAAVLGQGQAPLPLALVRGHSPPDDQLRLHPGALLRTRPALRQGLRVPPRRRHRDALRQPAARRLRGRVVKPNSAGALGSAYGKRAFRIRNAKRDKDIVIGHVRKVFVRPGERVRRGQRMRALRRRRRPTVAPALRGAPRQGRLHVRGRTRQRLGCAPADRLSGRLSRSATRYVQGQTKAVTE